MHLVPFGHGRRVSNHPGAHPPDFSADLSPAQTHIDPERGVIDANSRVDNFSGMIDSGSARKFAQTRGGKRNNVEILRCRKQSVTLEVLRLAQVVPMSPM